MSSLYIELLYRPLFNGLVFFYTALPVHDLGVSIILLTMVIRVALTPFLWKGQKAQRALAALQPEIKKIQETFKNDKEKQGRAMMELYAKHRVNPFSGCLALIIQLPVLIALFQVFHKGFNPDELSYLYSFIQNPGSLNPLSFGVFDLSKGSIWVGAVAALTQYFQTRLTLPSTPPSKTKGDFSQILQNQALYLFPGLILLWSWSLPSALPLYWTVLNIIGIVQEMVVRRIGKSEVRIAK
ncbi:MAG: preprotein translocase subunit YidC [Parcubacteria group bacterium Gr01-1014_33]|nr:MAG: preprotein translocase subunit YidC [Parcubacteria group bacterium Gr01-1014_33]